MSKTKTQLTIMKYITTPASVAFLFGTAWSIMNIIGGTSGEVFNIIVLSMFICTWLICWSVEKSSQSSKEEK